MASPKEKDAAKNTSTASLHQKLHNTDLEDALEQDSLGSAEDEILLTHESYAELQAKCNEAEQKATQYWERLLRMQAETDNLQRRMERDVESAHKYALEKFVNELLPVIDNLERSLQAHNNDSDDSGMLEGVRLTLQSFTAALAKFGVEQVSPEKEPFNPELHQAVSVQIDKTVKPGTVLGVLQKGYLLNKRLIRPAFVIVSKAD